MAALLQRHPGNKARLVIIGSCRNEGDEQRVRREVKDEISRLGEYLCGGTLDFGGRSRTKFGRVYFLEESQKTPGFVSQFVQRRPSRKPMAVRRLCVLLAAVTLLVIAVPRPSAAHTWTVAFESAAATPCRGASLLTRLRGGQLTGFGTHLPGLADEPMEPPPLRFNVGDRIMAKTPDGYAITSQRWGHFASHSVEGVEQRG